MRKRRSGPEGPDPDPEPFEIGTPDAALEHHNSDCDCTQPCLDALFAQYGDALPGIDPDQVVYDSGWVDSSGTAVRIVFGTGPESPYLQEWVRRLAFGLGRVDQTR